jgi:phosphoadenosine phosphosulfate reductase
MENQEKDIESLVIDIENEIQSYQARGLKLFASSSFQSHSIPMLHIISRIDNTIPIYFLETGYHFPKTIEFKNELALTFGLNIIPVSSPIPKTSQRDSNCNLLFTSDPDTCCHLNKVLPLEPILMSFDVWISGVRKDQTSFRASLKSEEQGAHDTLRYHPMLNWSARQIWEYQKKYDLPMHPLEKEGYMSIGCMPCTRKYEVIGSSDGRDSRWSGMAKTECGIHTELTKKN